MINQIINYFDTSKGSTGAMYVLFVILLAILLVILAYAIGFYVLLWAVNTLFHLVIAYTFKNFVAYMVLFGMFHSGETLLKSDKK